MGSRRLFVAIPVPDALRERLRTLQETLRPLLANVRWVRDDGIHVTLQFLGTTDEVILHDVVEALSGVARLHSSYDATCANLGVFPRIKGARIVWVGVEGNQEAFESLVRNVGKALRPFGFKPERRRFMPHITLGRVRGGERPDLLKEALQKHQGETFGGLRVEAFALYESVLHPKGAEYRVLHSCALER